MTITSLCLFGGSHRGADPAYADLATGLGTLVAARGLTLVHGGGTDGLMGVAAAAAFAGAIGERPARDVHASRPTGVVVAATRRDCTAAMVARADAAVVLPGGIGTMEALFAAMAGRSAVLHAGPIFLLGGVFWRPFRDLLGHLDRAGFAPGVFALIEPLAGLDALAARLDG